MHSLLGSLRWILPMGLSACWALVLWVIAGNGWWAAAGFLASLATLGVIAKRVASFLPSCLFFIAGGILTFAGALLAGAGEGVFAPLLAFEGTLPFIAMLVGVSGVACWFAPCLYAIYCATMQVSVAKGRTVALRTFSAILGVHYFIPAMAGILFIFGHPKSHERLLRVWHAQPEWLVGSVMLFIALNVIAVGMLVWTFIDAKRTG